MKYSRFNWYWLSYRFGSPSRDCEVITIRPSSSFVNSNWSNFIIQFKWTVNLQQTKIIVDGSWVIVRMAMFGDALVLFNSFWKVDIDASSDDISASNDTCATMSSTQDPIFIQNGTSTSEIRFSNHYQVMIEKPNQLSTYEWDPNIRQEIWWGNSPLSALVPPTIRPPKPLFKAFTGLKVFGILWVIGFTL